MPGCFREEHLAAVNTVLNHVVTTKAAYIMSREEFDPRIQHMRWWARAARSCPRLAQMILGQKPADGDDTCNEVVSRPRSATLTAQVWAASGAHVKGHPKELPGALRGVPTR